MALDRPLRLAVTGRQGQVTRALQDRAGPNLEVLAVGRPELDLSATGDFKSVFETLHPDVIVNAAAYTAVDNAERERDLALTINGAGAGAIAQTAAALEIPVIQLSTDYVFDGSSSRPYREDDATSPVNYYGISKLAGEEAVRSANPYHVILRTSWVYGPYGQNFLRTMLRLAEARNEIRVVDDQIGAPTSALDIAAAVEMIARNLISNEDNQNLLGIFHLTNAGETSWAGFARAIFEFASLVRAPRVIPIATAEYPTPAKRPASSRLDLSKIKQEQGFTPPHWRNSLRIVIDLLERDSGSADGKR